jgi:hypothetical protein
MSLQHTIHILVQRTGPFSALSPTLVSVTDTILKVRLTPSPSKRNFVPMIRQRPVLSFLMTFENLVVFNIVHSAHPIKPGPIGHKSNINDPSLSNLMGSQYKSSVTHASPQLAHLEFCSRPGADLSTVCRVCDALGELVGWPHGLG